MQPSDLKSLIAGQLLRRDSVGFARKPSVETATRRNQGPFICRDRIQHGGDIGLPSVSVTELPHGFGVGTQFAHGLVHARRHDRWVAKSMLGSFFERAEIPFPVQAKVQTYIEDRGSIERHRFTLGRCREHWRLRHWLLYRGTMNNCVCYRETDAGH